MAAKYLVQVEPGFAVPSFGFVRPGETFDAPANLVPSITFRAMNDEAAVELEKAFDAREALLKERLTELTGGADRYRVRNEIEDLRVRRLQAKTIPSVEELGRLRGTLSGQRNFTNR